MLADDPWLFAQAAVGAEELVAVEAASTEVVGYLQGLVYHLPAADRAGIPHRIPHEIGAAGNQIDEGSRAERILLGGFSSQRAHIAYEG